MILLPMTCKVRAEGVGLIYALHMMVIIVDNLWNEEILLCLTLKNRDKDTSVFRRDFRIISYTLNSIFASIEAIDSRNSDNRLIVLLKEA
jgi:hypothetical protein